jgi:GTPase SAR1 family protein
MEIGGVTNDAQDGIPSPVESQTEDKSVSKEVTITPSLEGLQSDEQRRVLDTVAQIRKCGLESVLSLPQLVMCGDQSSGKSSVLEAPTEIPFPRNDNLCTRFATEIILRRAAVNSITVKVIPDSTRPAQEQASIKSFTAGITDFAQLSGIMNKAMGVMGLDPASTSRPKPRAFAKDVLSIEIEGPTRPQLTLVDIPGLIQTETKGVTTADKELVTEITHQYISQPRTICLAVVSASNDYANQGILTKVREVDPEGGRTLGIITKPDRLPSGSGSESAYMDLARNQDIFFKLGWHVIKNRTFEQTTSSFEERNASEATYFRNSNFQCLPKDCVGIDALRTRLSALLFEHVKQELPSLRNDLEEAMSDANAQLAMLGDRRTSPSDCRSYLARLSLDFFEVSRAAVGGHYEGDYFHRDIDSVFSISSTWAIRRFRAVVQFMNTQFSEEVQTKGQKYQIDLSDHMKPRKPQLGVLPGPVNTEKKSPDSKGPSPIKMSKDEALNWVSQVLIRTRGKELLGNYNPLLIGELFWEQCSNWESLAKDYVEQVAQLCRRFLDILLNDKCPKDICSRLWSSKIQDILKSRNSAALKELRQIMEDISGYPINYNHYYTDTIQKVRESRRNKSLSGCLEKATTHTHLPGCNSDHSSASIDIGQALKNYSRHVDPNMENLSCEEALDCLFAIYKVSKQAPSSPIWIFQGTYDCFV